MKGRVLQNALFAAVLRLPGCAPALQQLRYAEATRHALPRVVGYGHGQWKGQGEPPPDGLQVAVDVVQGAAVLEPLLACVAGRDDGEQVRSAGPCVAFGYFLQRRFVGYGYFVGGAFGRVYRGG